MLKEIAALEGLSVSDVIRQFARRTYLECFAEKEKDLPK